MSNHRVSDLLAMKEIREDIYGIGVLEQAVGEDVASIVNIMEALKKSSREDVAVTKLKPIQGKSQEESSLKPSKQIKSFKVALIDRNGMNVQICKGLMEGNA